MIRENGELQQKLSESESQLQKANQQTIVAVNQHAETLAKLKEAERKLEKCIGQRDEILRKYSGGVINYSGMKYELDAELNNTQGES
jgi:flagellar motility protein MotE (MotC chaperone)